MAHSDTQEHQPPTPIFLPIEEVVRRCAISRRTVYNLIDSGEFPKPVKIGDRRVAFVEAEVVQWQQRKMKERRA